MCLRGKRSLARSLARSLVADKYVGGSLVLGQFKILDSAAEGRSIHRHPSLYDTHCALCMMMNLTGRGVGI
jgi:hypothetical protein